MNLVASGLKGARRINGGAVAGGLVASVAVESATFADEVKAAYEKYKRGHISESDFRQQLAKAGCECAGGLAASTVVGLVCQLVIPLPVVGGFIGCTLGNLVGRWCGAMIGKQLVSVK